MLEQDFKKGMTYPKFRGQLIDCARIALEQDFNWQKNKTPMEIVDKMISKTELTGKTILVMFNIEFMERLIHKYHVPAEKIFFFADHELERRFVEKIYNVKTTCGSVELMSQENKGKIHPLTERILTMGQKKFDLVFSNPSYNNGIDLKILGSILSLCKELVVVHPSTWLLDIKNTYGPFVCFKKLIEDRIASIEFFNGNTIFDIGLFVPCIIMHICEYNKGKICIDHFDDTYESDDVYNITKFGKKWETIVKPFLLKVKNYVLENGNVWQYNKLDIDQNKSHCQLANLRGNVNKTGSGLNIVQDDFYTLVMKKSDRNKGIRKEIKIDNPTPTFEFETVEEMANFIEYCKNDFVRFCLALLKNKQHLVGGNPMAFIPWMDFTQQWDDKKLYKFFDIDKKTQKYIENFLPDYYGIREDAKEKTYFGSVAVKNSTGGEKSTNIYIDKDKAKELTDHINKMVEETDKDETPCLFLSKERKRLTVTRKFWEKAKKKK